MASCRHNQRRQKAFVVFFYLWRKFEIYNEDTKEIQNWETENYFPKKNTEYALIFQLKKTNYYLTTKIAARFCYVNKIPFLLRKYDILNKPGINVLIYQTNVESLSSWNTTLRNLKEIILQILKELILRILKEIILRILKELLLYWSLVEPVVCLSSRNFVGLREKR
jgi:hypothetical protein